ncbi:uncharacterized protein TNCV_1854411 [Trichonephila clavipes]|nr:uncharacterized protein TNCV_1854411 [Trichonephila clavipes]
MPSPVQSNCDAHETIANGQYGAVWSIGHTQQVCVRIVLLPSNVWQQFFGRSAFLRQQETDLPPAELCCIVKNKRPNTRAGGVAIYQNSSDAVNIITPSMECSVSQFDINGTIQSLLGDLCLAECVIDNGHKIIIVAVYITQNKKLDDIIEFLHRSLLPYTSRGSALLNQNYDKIPMILSGDFKVNFALDKSLQLIEFLKDNFTLSLQNKRIISRTK